MNAPALAPFERERAALAPNSLRGYDEALRRLERFLRDHHHITLPGPLGVNPAGWALLNAELITAYFAWMIGEGYSLTSVNLATSAIKCFAAAAHQSGMLDQATALAVGKLQRPRPEQYPTPAEPRRQRRPANPNPITPEVASQLKTGQPLTAQGQRDALLLSLAIDHGLYQSELIDLEVSDLDLEAGTLRVRSGRLGTPPFPLSPDARQAAQRYLPLLGATSGPLLRPSNRAGQLADRPFSSGNTEASLARGLTLLIRRIGKRAGLEDLTLSDCRAYAKRGL